MFLLDFWGSLDIWGRFFLVVTAATWIHGVWDMRPLFGRQHVLGAEIIGLSLIVTHVLERSLNDKSPVAAFAILDVATAGLFLWQALAKKAVWAALCVIVYFFMGLAHVAFIMTGQANELRYHQNLDALYGAALLIINCAILAGRHAWGESWDYRIDRIRRGWTFSGIRLPRCSGHT